MSTFFTSARRALHLAAAVVVGGVVLGQAPAAEASAGNTTPILGLHCVRAGLAVGET